MGDFSGNGVIRTGAFTALPISPHDWRIRCDHLPEWSLLVQASERDVAHLLQLAQAEYRDTWKGVTCLKEL